MIKYLKFATIILMGWAIIPAVTGIMIGLAGADADLVRAASIFMAMMYPAIFMGVAEWLWKSLS